MTLQTIADRVGVSRMTVSNAFSRPDQLSAALREKILATAAELGYAGPDPAARTLARGATGTVGVLFHGSPRAALSDEFSALFLAVIAEELGRGGLALTLLPNAGSTDVVAVSARATSQVFRAREPEGDRLPNEVPHGLGRLGPEFLQSVEWEPPVLALDDDLERRAEPRVGVHDPREGVGADRSGTRRGVLASDAQRKPGSALSGDAKAEVEYLLGRLARLDARAGRLAA